MYRHTGPFSVIIPIHDIKVYFTWTQSNLIKKPAQLTPLGTMRDYFRLLDTILDQSDGFRPSWKEATGAI